jgi:citrate lyase subunit beta / citryl-CoA lyase
MTNIRSILFIPGDNERKLSKADSFAADALILDLEDSVAPARKLIAREIVRAFLDARNAARRTQLWVRINPLNHPGVLQDLAAVVGGRPDGIMQPKTNGPRDVERLSHYLDALEARDGVAAGHVKVMPVTTETAVAPFRLGDYANFSLPRLVALTWGAEDLSSAIGASTNKGPNGDWDFPYQVVRAACLFASHAAGVQAIDTLYGDYRDPNGLRASCDLARRQGFTGRVAIHPDQLDIINKAFSPSEEDVARARRIVAAFEAEPDVGTIGLDSEMLDLPHLNRARRLIAIYELYAGTL